MPSRPGVAWCAMALVLLLGSLIAFTPAAKPVLEWQPERAIGEPWRAWSAAFVHYSRLHLIGNLTGLALTAAFGWVSRVPTGGAVAWGVAWPLTHLGLLMQPSLAHYGGLSGVLHGLFLLGLLPMARRGDRIAIACLVYLAGKLAWEQIMGTPLSDEQAIGGHVVTLAHLFGTLAALVYGFAFGTFRRGVSTQ